MAASQPANALIGMHVAQVPIRPRSSPAPAPTHSATPAAQQALQGTAIAARANNIHAEHANLFISLQPPHCCSSSTLAQQLRRQNYCLSSLPPRQMQMLPQQMQPEQMQMQIQMLPRQMQICHQPACTSPLVLQSACHCSGMPALCLTSQRQRLHSLRSPRSLFQRLQPMAWTLTQATMMCGRVCLTR